MSKQSNVPISQQALAEFLGTAMLLIGVIGSGIMAERLTSDVGLQLLQNALATAGVLVAIILSFAWVSGAHFNPAVTLTARLLGELETRQAALFMAAQTAGAAVGACLANLMFDRSVVSLATTDRAGSHLIVAEVVATLGLLLVIWGVVRSGNTQAVAFAVAAYIGGAYYFTSSTSFANPAVTLARTLSDSFAGISPSSVPGFVGAQFLGVAIAVLLIRRVFANSPTS